MGEALAPRHSSSDYEGAFRSLLPTGPAWEEEHENLSALIEGLSSVFAEPFDRIAALFLDTESDPRFTRQLLSDWEKAFGLPDDCVSTPLTVEDRINALINRMTLAGGQSVAFFISLAKSLGYDITITEFAPFMAGASRCGDDWWCIGPPEIRFYWSVHVSAARLSWFRAGSGQAGVDHHLEFSIAEDLECILRRYKPAQTEVVFDYSQPLDEISSPYAGV